MFSVYLEKGGIEGVYKFPWKVSIVAFMANPATLKGAEVKETFEFITSDPFFDVIEIHPLPNELWEVVDPIVKKAGVEVAYGAQPLVLMEKKNPSSLNEKERKEAVEAIKGVVDLAAERGVKKVAFCSGPDPGLDRRKEATQALIESLKEIAGYAKEKGVYIILETFDRNWDKKQLIGPISEAVEVAKAVREEYDNFGLMWDLSHGPMLGEKPQDLYIAKDYLAHVHIGCTKETAEGLKDWHPGFYRPGAVNGIEDVKDFIAFLADIGYKGAVGFEVKPEEGQYWPEVVQAAKGVLYTAYVKYLLER
ncbi:MAG: sugar phosphate isomerase/epimerase [Thermoprotei archaeon]|nr:MAG: sugar phosphate isomerase/epimerase [Thermoprotei archaeon]